MQFKIPEKVCDICGKVYKRKLHNFSSEFLPVIDSSHVRVQIENDKSTEIYHYDICPACANTVLCNIIKMQTKRPIKCEFCEFDRGPRESHKHPDCKSCWSCFHTNYSNFQLKKRMCAHQNYEWQQYKRYFGEVNE